jgi:hypothetical protein
MEALYTWANFLENWIIFALGASFGYHWLRRRIEK